jgi:hypothetical protein
MLTVETDRQSAFTLVDYSPYLSAPKNKEEDASRFLKECEEFKMLDEGVPCFNGRENTLEFFCQTPAQGNWRIRFVHPPTTRYNYVNGNAPQMDALEQTLAGNQNFAIPFAANTGFGKHGRIQHFVAANQDLLDRVLTNRKMTETGARASKIFIEPSIPDPENTGIEIFPDMLQVGTDNKVRVYEIGNSTKKPLKTKKYAAGLQKLYQGLTQTALPSERVLPFVLQYSQEGDINVVSLFDPGTLSLQLRKHQRNQYNA